MRNNRVFCKSRENLCQNVSFFPPLVLSAGARRTAKSRSSWKTSKKFPYLAGAFYLEKLMDLVSCRSRMQWKNTPFSLGFAQKMQFFSVQGFGITTHKRYAYTTTYGWECAKHWASRPEAGRNRDFHIFSDKKNSFFLRLESASRIRIFYFVFVDKFCESSCGLRAILPSMGRGRELCVRVLNEAVSTRRTSLPLSAVRAVFSLVLPRRGSPKLRPARSHKFHFPLKRYPRGKNGKIDWWTAVKFYFEVGMSCFRT